MTEKELSRDENYFEDAAPVVGDVISVAAAAGVSTPKSFGATGPEEIMRPRQSYRYESKRFSVAPFATSQDDGMTGLSR